MVAVLKEDSYARFQRYLADERVSETKHELIEGYVFAMAGASDNHNKITSNANFLFSAHIREHDLSCFSYIADMKAKVDDDNCYYPDVMVICDREDNEDEYYKTSPKIIVEVLSKSTRSKDKGKKRLYYQTMPTLEEYVLIEQNFCEIEVFRKNNNWNPTYYHLGDELTFESLDLTVPVAELYYQANNEDMREFLASAK